MTKPGPKPDPTALRKLKGNPSNTPFNEHEPHPDPLTDKDPVEWMNPETDYMQEQKFPIAKVSEMIWRELEPQLSKMGTLTHVDRNKLARYCDMFARWLKMKAFIDRHGESYPVYGTMYEQEMDDEGKPKRDAEGKEKRATCKKVLKQMRSYPQMGAYIKIGSELKRYEEEFGIGAASRTRIQTIVDSNLGGDEKRPDEFDYAAKEGKVLGFPKRA